MSEVVAINRSDRVALTDDGAVIEWDQMFDIDGDDTDDPALALVATAELPDGRWTVIVLAEFDQAATLN
jgi:hypothetical protein